VSLEILAYVGAALMVVLAILAYRYWHSTATYARRMREAYAHQRMRPLVVSAPTHLAPVDSELLSDETAEDPVPVGPTSATTGRTAAESPEEPIESSPEADDATEPFIEAAEESVAETTSAASLEAEPVPPNDSETSLTEPAEDSTAPDAQTSADGSGDEPAEPAAASVQAESEETPDEAFLRAEYRLIEELEPRDGSSRSVEAAGSVAALLKELDEKLAALPTGIELFDLPVLERRRIADRRDELLNDRARLLEQKKRGAHRRRRRSGATG
jgi:hypothetical protein